MEEEILDSLPTGVIYVDEDGIIRYLNRFAAAALSVSREAAVGQPLQAVVPRNLSPAYGVLEEPRDPEASWCHRDKLAAPSPTPPAHCTLSRYHAYPLDGRAPSCRGTLIILGEATPAASQPEPSAPWSLKPVESCTPAKLSHELNQSLQVIMGYMSLITMELSSDHPSQQYLAKIFTQVENIRLLAQKLAQVDTSP